MKFEQRCFSHFCAIKLQYSQTNIFLVNIFSKIILKIIVVDRFGISLTSRIFLPPNLGHMQLTWRWSCVQIFIIIGQFLNLCDTVKVGNNDFFWSLGFQGMQKRHFDLQRTVQYSLLVQHGMFSKFVLTYQLYYGSVEKRESIISYLQNCMRWILHVLV